MGHNERMITHVVLLTLKPGTDPAAAERLGRSLTDFAVKLDGCLAYLAAPSDKLRPGADFVILADFQSEAAWKHYAEHPLHLRIIQEQLLPITERRESTQIRR